MATTKSTKKKPVIKKKLAKKVKASAVSGYRHFKLQKSTEPFLTLRLSIQTLYWTILIVFVAALAVWIINLQISINSIYDKIEQEQVLSNQIDKINERLIENKRAINANKKAIGENKAAINTQKMTQ